MKIAYGPPGAVGVKSLQYVGNIGDIGDDADYISSGLTNYVKPAFAIAAGVAIYAWSAKNKKLQKQAGAVALGAALVSLLVKS